MKRILAIFVCLLLVGTIFLAAAAVAPKPPKPPKPDPDPGPTATGTIYFNYNEGSGSYIWTMNADGSQKTKQIKNEAGISSLSYEKHGDHYWWIGYKTIDEETYPDNQPRQEIHAIRDDKVKSIQLTNDATMGFSQYCRIPIWGFGDGFISWAAKKWVHQEDESWVIDESGIFKQSISFDTNGDVIGLIGEPTLVYDPGLLYIEVENFYMIDSDTHNWAPSNTKIVNCEQDGDMYIIDTTQPVDSQETYLRSGWDAKWSPDGNWISFEWNDDVNIIKPDGTGEKTIAQNREKGGWWNWLRASMWSPDSKFVSYSNLQRSSHNLAETKTDIYYVGIDGSDKTCLTKDLSQSLWKSNWYWR